jgi:hypothetical protein
MSDTNRLSLRELYLYLVCLVTLVISLFAAVSLVRSAVELAYPDPGAYGWIAPPEAAGELDEAERTREEELVRDSQRRSAVLGLVTAGTTIAIAGPAYAYHWRRVQEERARQRTAVAAA